MKPRVFIGSSVEGLSVAYAIQQNLNHVAEPTVWDQGIFDLSKTTIESLTRAVEESDFGIFVFSPDDITKMRGTEYNSIRDNVIFEFGLFTGRLGRDRVFFIKPDGAEVHLPTDLLGINPGTYNPSREDGRLQAATGPACNQIREAMMKLPVISIRNGKSESEEIENSDNAERSNWLIDLFNDKYDEAREKLTSIIQDSTGDELLTNQAWMAFIELKENEVSGLDKLLNFGKENKNSKPVLSTISQMLSMENYHDHALEKVDLALEQWKDDIDLIILKAKILSHAGDKDDAIALLENEEHVTIPAVAVALCEICEDDDLKKTIEIAHAAYTRYPSSKEITFKYARLLQENNSHKEAIYLLDKLCKNYPKEVLYLGYMSNTCLNLNLYEKAMSSLKKAIDLSNKKEAWLLHNVGNLFRNKGFYSEAEYWLRKGLEINPDSEYALDRLTSVMKSRTDEDKTFSAICNEGKSILRKKNSTESQAGE